MINSNFSILYSKHAQKELQDAVQWYNKQRKGLGLELKIEIKRVVDNIITNPTFASIEYDQIRVASCKVFPFTVHYEIDIESNVVRIISIFHTKRNPFWT
jgi:toxin ParE1/3/4